MRELMCHNQIFLSQHVKRSVVISNENDMNGMYQKIQKHLRHYDMDLS